MTLEGHTIIELSVSDTATQEFTNDSIMLDGGGLPWPVVLARMISFLGQHYGYDISQEVALRRNPARVSGGWQGPFWGIATDEEIRVARALQEAEDNGGQLDLDFGDRDE